MSIVRKSKAEPTTEIELITPEIAKQYLETNTNNRRLSKTIINKYAKDMAGGRWKFAPEPVMFSEAGVMINGQHRMHAIIQACVSIRMWVVRGVDPTVMEVIDTGKLRSLTDRALISGRFGNVTNDHAATAKKMFSGMLISENSTVTEEMKKLEVHWGAVDFACRELKYKIPGVANAATRAVVARAFYSVDHLQLKHFCHVLTTGEMKDEDDAVILLLIRFLIATPTHGRTIRNEKYRKTERALDAWLGGEKLTKLYPTQFELFPLPEETGERTS